MQYRSLTRFLLYSSSISVGTYLFVILGTISWGYSIAYMNNALETMEMLLGMKDPYLGLKQGVLVTSMIVGAFVGVLLSFYLVKSTPRRRFLYLIDLIFILGSLIIQVQDYWVMVGGRFVQGIACGMSSVLVPLILKEISPVKIYSIIGGQNLVLQRIQIFIIPISYAVGIVIASSLGLFFPRKEDLKSVDDISKYFWRAYVSVPILFSLIRITLVTFVYKFETPVYCYMSGEDFKGIEFIKYFYNVDSWFEVEQYYSDQNRVRQNEIQIRIKDLFKSHWKGRMRLGVILNIAQQTTGANAVVSYSTIIFEQFTSIETARLLTLALSVQKILFYSSTVAVWQNYGRRRPILIGTAVIMVTDLSLGICSYMTGGDMLANSKYLNVVDILIVIMVFVYFIGFFHSLGAIAVYLPEFLPEVGVVFSFCVQWMSNIVVTLSFPVIKQYFGIQFCFGFYGFMTLIWLLYFCMSIKETSGLTETQVDRLFLSKSMIYEELSHTEDMY